MFTRFLLAAIFSLFATLSAAQERSYLGYGRLITNDSLSTFQDRWRTGSVASSRVIGRGWSGELPAQPFDLLEFRLGGQIITPGNILHPSSKDRPYVGAFHLGVHTHFERKSFEYSLGVDATLIGPQTGMFDLQTALHDALGFAPPSQKLKKDQLQNARYFGLTGEVGREFKLSDRAVLRPFAEGLWGPEDVFRIGADLHVGSVGQGELLVRDPVTGHRYRVIKHNEPGFSFVVGGDWSYVSDSVYLPNDRAAQLRHDQYRLRIGTHWQGETSALFYGLTWLSEEFDSQPEGQLVGSIRLNIRF